MNCDFPLPLLMEMFFLMVLGIMRLPKKPTRKGPKISSSTDPPPRMDHPDATPSPPPKDSEVPAGTEVATVAEGVAYHDVEEVVFEDVPPPPPHYELQRLQLRDKDSCAHLSIAENTKYFRLHKFEISFVNGPDVLTEPLIRDFPYDENNLLISVGQLAAGMLLPLFSRKDPFYYDVLSSRDEPANKTQVRGVMQYTGNCRRALHESWYHSKGKTTLESYDHFAEGRSKREDYTPANFNATYADAIQKSNLLPWSVGPRRIHVTARQIREGNSLRLLEEIDKTGLTTIPNSARLSLPKSDRIRLDHDDCWARTPLRVVGPWAYGFTTADPSVPRSARSLPEKYDRYRPWIFNPAPSHESAPASSAETAPGSAGNFVATRTRKRKALVKTLAESFLKKGKLKTVIDLNVLDDDPKDVGEVPGDEDMEDIEDTGLSPHLDDIEEDFSKDNPSPVRATSVEGENLLVGFGAQLVESVSVQDSAPTLSLKMPSFSAPSKDLPVTSVAAGTAVVASKSLSSSPATSLQSSGLVSKVVTPTVRVGSSDSQQKKKVVISLTIFSFNAAPASLGSAQSVSIAPISKVVGPPPLSPDWTVLGNLPSAGDMDLGGSQDPLSVPSSSIMPSLRRGEGLAFVPLARVQTNEGDAAESSQGRLLESLSLGSSDDAILEDILRDSKGLFSVGVDHHHLGSSFEIASQLDVLSAQYSAAKDFFFDPDCLRSSQSFGEIRMGSIQEIEDFMDTYANFLPRLSAFSIDVGYTLFKVYRSKCTHLSALLERARQEYSLDVAQQPSSGDATSAAKISSLEDDLGKTQRSLEACLLSLERANNAAKVAEDGRKAADTALAAESSKSIAGSSSELRCLQDQVAKLTSDVWYYQKKSDMLMNVIVHNEAQFPFESAHNAGLVKQMASLRKECDEAFSWKESLILKRKEDITLVEKRLSAQEIIHKKYHVDFEDACASLAKVTAERNVLTSEVRSLKKKLVDASSVPSSMSHASLVKRFEELENVYQALSSKNVSLRIDVDDLRTERDTLVEDLDATEVDLVEAQHCLEESLSHAGGFKSSWWVQMPRGSDISVGNISPV
ncbi:uncharacterized protein LOC113317588 isoform X2 [Papaver somniferum]|uniref:uncharacterized protein LOC113317588 isoform X2 n=1 Tax=Papaver somniferum TaxID=3469 RepID=UPI000E6FD3BB|nr:uncharacterized protein LOC113317588 isoform X2 [Papaver somniferum]